MAGALAALGAGVTLTADGDWVIAGLDGPPRHGAQVWCAMAGTVARFVVPMLAAGRGSFSVDGHAQLRRRPLGPLLRALEAQGAVIDGDTLPLELEADGLRGGEVAVDASVSSQFLSGLVMAAPLAAGRTRLCFDTLVSRPYLQLTLDVMGAFGVVAPTDEHSVTVTPTRYRPATFAVEPDASTASYFLASAALTGTTVSLPGLELDRTAQGDIEVARSLARMGATVTGSGTLSLSGPSELHGIEVDMGDSSDAFMTLACVAPFALTPTTIEGIAHARVKESDRIAATAENLRRLGISVDEGRRPSPDPPRRATAGATAHLRRPPDRDGVLVDRHQGSRGARGSGCGRQDMPVVLRAVAQHGRHSGARGKLMVVAIDGPAGAGKSTVARALARRLGFTYLDSGAMYRGVALVARQRGAEPAEVARAA